MEGTELPPHERVRSPFHVWVKYIDGEAVKVDATDCRNVAGLKELAKTRLDLADPVDLISLCWSSQDGSTVLAPTDPGVTMEELAKDSRFKSNSSTRPLIVQVRLPDTSPQRIRSGSRSTVQPPHDPHRVQRWGKLNDILWRNFNRSAKRNSVAFANVTWQEVSSILRPTETNFLTPMEIPEAAFKILSDYTSFAAMSFELNVHESEDEQRLHFVAPILLCVCNLFKGEVKISADVSVSGHILRAHGRIDFVLKHGDKRIFVVEAKNQFLPEGMKGALLGCEVAAELGHLNNVFGIVTTYERWVFLRSLNDRIERRNYRMEMEHGSPTEESLKFVSGMIYAMLSD